MSDLNGRPITGEISRFATPPPTQDDPQKLLDALDAVLNVPGVEAVMWEQGTPSWNDGDVCVFGVRSPRVRIIGDEYEDSDYGDNSRDVYDLYEYTTSDKEYLPIGGYDTKAISDALNAFEHVLDTGKHNIVLSEKFGDPARVIATKDGFEVEYTEVD